MLALFSLPVMFIALTNIVHIRAADDPTSVMIERLRQIQVRTSKRQSSNDSIPLSDVPPQCQSVCAPAVDALNTCTTADCICNPLVDSSLGECISCVVNSEPSSIQGGQQVLDAYNSLCEGYGVSSLSVSTFSVSSLSASGSLSVTGSLNVSITASQSGTSASTSATVISVTGSSSSSQTTTYRSPSSTSSSSATPSASNAAIGAALPISSLELIGLVVSLLIMLLA